MKHSGLRFKTSHVSWQSVLQKHKKKKTRNFKKCKHRPRMEAARLLINRIRFNEVTHVPGTGLYSVTCTGCKCSFRRRLWRLPEPCILCDQ